MRQHISPFEFYDHRQFLRDAIKSRGLSYRAFAEKHPEIISLDTLSGTLSRGRGGLKSRPRRNFSCEMLARLGKALRLNDDEIDYLIHLKLENDAESLSGPWGSAYLDSAKRSLALISAQHHKKENENKGNIKEQSFTALTIGELVDFFPGSAKRRVSKMILLEAAAILNRHGKKAGLSSFLQAKTRLEGLIKSGLPD